MQADDHNLWVIDERLVYHSYLASDKLLRGNPQINSSSSKRPDIVVFNKAHAFVDSDAPFSSVVIIEFKRAMRDDYSDDENPINQVLEYVRKIREGTARTEEGRDIPIAVNIPFYCYIVADITPPLAKQAENYSYAKMPDGQGYFGFNNTINAYVELMPYSKLVSDAKKRNAAFFRKLGLPDRIGSPSEDPPVPHE